MRGAHAVEISIPRDDVFVVEPGAHHIAQFETRQVERPFEISKRLLRLCCWSQLSRRRPKPANQAMS